MFQVHHYEKVNFVDFQFKDCPYGGGGPTLLDGKGGGGPTLLDGKEGWLSLVTEGCILNRLLQRNVSLIFHLIPCGSRHELFIQEI